MLEMQRNMEPMHKKFLCEIYVLFFSLKYIFIILSIIITNRFFY